MISGLRNIQFIKNIRNKNWLVKKNFEKNILKIFVENIFQKYGQKISSPKNIQIIKNRLQVGKLPKGSGSL